MASDLEDGFLGFMVLCGLIGAAIMAVLFLLVPWLWSVFKPWLHALTG